jgi:hypothetical protein
LTYDNGSLEIELPGRLLREQQSHSETIRHFEAEILAAIQK